MTLFSAKGAQLQPKEGFRFKRFFQNKGNIFLLIEAIFFVWFVFSFLIYPNLNLFADVLFSGNLKENIEKILESERAMKAIKNSFILAITMCVTVNIVGTLVVFITEYFQIKGKLLC